MQQYDFKISYEDNGIKYPLPYALFQKKLKFTWETPPRVQQHSYIFEMRTIDPILYNDGKTYMCAYYSSARVYSNDKFHYIDTVNGETIDIANWAGVCEIRLRIFDKEGAEYCSHDIILDDTRYDFQRDYPQYRYWGSRNDGYYFCFDAVQDNLKNTQNVKFYFKGSEDIDNHQKLQYVLQISDSPLFGSGLHSKSLIEKKDIILNSTYGNISAAFQWEKDPSKWEDETLEKLKPNTIYYFRIRSFDGYDYSQWSRVNAVKMIRNSIPQPIIHGVYYPIGTVKNNTDFLTPVNNVVVNPESEFPLIQENRVKGQIVVELSVQDDDNDYVICELAYSMELDENEANKLGVVLNPTGEKLDYYDDEDKKKLLRANTQQLLLKIPTNQKINITWNTANEIIGTQKKFVYLYFYVNDGDNDNVFVNKNPLVINNTYIGVGDGTNLPKLNYWCKGNLARNHAYPVLPDTMIRQLLSTTNGVKEYSSSLDEIPKAGSIGYTNNTSNAGANWFDYWQKFEDGLIKIGEKENEEINSPKLYGTEKITQKGFIVKHYDKYPTVQDGSSSYQPTSSSSDVEGFIMFCSICNDLQIMENKILLENGKIYESLETAFPNDSFDGTPYSLVFVCPKCHHAMMMEQKYQTDLAYKTLGSVKKEEYSYYHGYNSDENYQDNDILMKQLMATRESDFNALQEDWKNKNGDSKKSPYTFELFHQWYGDKESSSQQISKENNGLLSSEKFGFMPEHALLNLSKNPEISPFFMVNPPRIEKFKYAPYVDGTRLNETIYDDYMYDFEPQEGGTNLEGDYFPPKPGDPDLIRLSKQFPWNMRNRINYEFVESKKSLKYDEKTGYVSSGDDKEGKQEEKQEEKEVPTYKVVHVRFDAENPCVSHVYQIETNKTIVYSRASVALNIQFPLLIQRNVNDKYKIILNDKITFEGSILQDNIQVQTCNFPYTNNNANSFLSNILGQSNGYLSKMFNQCFTIPSVSEGQFSKYNSEIANKENQQMFFNIYGRMEKHIKKIEILECQNSCYELFGLKQSVIFQNSSDFPGEINKGYLHLGLELSTDNQAGGNHSKTPEDKGHMYYYTELQQNEHKYDWEENPIDNKIEDDFGVLSTVTEGEPLFTCYKNEVDKRGFHFKFTEEDFQKTGKIYVRKYHVQPCNSFPKPGFGVNDEPGFRNWIVVPIDGKPGRYYKKKVLNSRGIPAFPKIIDVMTEQGKIQEWGYFESSQENAKCISHKEQEKNSSSIESKDEPKLYTREEKDTWKNKMLPKTCVVFEYVDITEAITKNIVDMQQKLNPFTHKTPIIFNQGIFNEFLNRYGTYVMGGYDLTEDQKKLQNNGLSYEKVFSSSVMTLEDGSAVSSWVEYTDLVPNNWRPQLINSIFDADAKEKQNYDVLIEKKNKKDQEEAFERKSIDSYDRYKKIWENKVKLNENMKQMQMSQITVQQFNPGINAHFGIYKKYGYQPKYKVEEYWKIDQDSLYGVKYIPFNSKIVNDIYDDFFANMRIRGQILRQRKLISDKSFMRIDDTYDKLPFLDYRLIGKINGIAMQYFSGYPRSQHSAYKNRPDVVYPYDRQWRIGGLNRTAYVNNNIHPYYNTKYQHVKLPFQVGINNDSEGYQRPYGMYINHMLSYDSKSCFYYIQDEWNTYNRIHWDSVQNLNQYACLYAQKVDENLVQLEDRFSVKTVTSIWDTKLKRWCIPYNENMSDMVDTLKAGLENDCYYVFHLDVVDKYSHTIIESFSSKSFLISQSAISPVTITETEYDPWTQDLTIYFRFDDALGRTYDIVELKYQVKDVVENGIRQDAWKTADVNLLQGELYDLTSNLFGDDVANKNLIIIHKVVLNIGELGITSTDSLRVQLFSSLALDRKGLTMPVFNIKLWANEFLKPVQERLRFLQGYKNRWVYDNVLEHNSETGQTTVNGQWKYVSQEQAVTVPGSIQLTSNKIENIEKEFNKNYCQIAAFRYPDYNAWENWLKGNEHLWEEFYNVNIFNHFLNDKNIKNKYDAFLEENKDSGNRESYLKRAFLIKNSLTYELEKYYQENKFRFLDEIKSTKLTEFNDWFSKESNKIPDYASFRQKYADKYEKEYLKYFNISLDNISDSSSSSSTIEKTDESIMQFIIKSNKVQDFISFYTKTFMFVDTRFEERAWIMYSTYGVQTEGLWYGDYLNSNVTKADLSSITGDNLSDIYMKFLSDKENKDLGNIGKSLYRITFLYSPTGDGSTYNVKYQSLNNTLNQLYQELNEKKMLKNQLDTEHRRGLIKQGYFCNGFENNLPYKEDKSINTCFRWRVETRNYEGNIESNTSYDDQGNSTFGWQPRFDMYIRFQLDFFHTFDSQKGLPLRDILFLKDREGNNERILASIKNADKPILTYPDSVPNAEKTVNIPKYDDGSVDKKEQNNYEYSSYDINALQLTASIGLPKNMLPGYDQNHNDILPFPYQNGWDKLVDKSQYICNDDFKSVYYWRIAPYNIVERPIFESMMGQIEIINSKRTNRQIIINNYFGNSNIESTNYNSSLFAAYEKLIYPWENKDIEDAMYSSSSSSQHEIPYWKKSINSIVYPTNADDLKKNTPYNNDWVNMEMICRGEVQFITDRPREMTLENIVEQSSSSFNGYAEFHADTYQIKFNNEPAYTYKKIKDTYTIVNDELVPVYARDYKEIKLYLFYAIMNNKKNWFISRQLPGNQPLSPQINQDNTITFNQSTLIIEGFRGQVNKLKIYEGKQTRNDYWLFHSSLENIYPSMTSTELWYSNGSYRPTQKVDIITTDISSSTDVQPEYGDSFFKQAKVNYINDNLGNFDTIWYPYSPIRKKPFVFRLYDEYLLFSYKQKGTFYVAKENKNYTQNVITLSRGFTNNLFGEEGVCFPKYIYQSLDEIIPKAYSFENPCVINLQNGIYRMYFNVKFYDEEKGFSTQIYKADTVDFENWQNFEKVIMNFNDQHISNCFEPFVKLTIKQSSSDTESSDSSNNQPQFIYQFDMYLSSKDVEDSYFTIKHYISYDGINFNFNEKIHNDGSDGMYNCCSPCLYEDNNIKKLYFTIISNVSQSSTDTSELIVSLDWIHEKNDWRKYQINGESRLIIEKGPTSLVNKPFNGTFSEFKDNKWINSHYSNPCVIQDFDNGCLVPRMYYNTYDTPYLWYEKELILANGLKELTIHSEYLQQYKWTNERYEYNNDYYIQIDYSEDKETWKSLKPRNDSAERDMIMPANAYLKYVWNSQLEVEQLYGIKINLQPSNDKIINLSQGKWIQFDNYMNTSAFLSPETLSDYSYSLEKYSPVKFIMDYNLMGEYQQWLTENEQISQNDAELEFIISNKYYSQYLWWSRQGSCIYRYVGKQIMQYYDWQGSDNG